MVVHYTSETLQTIWNSTEFKKNYDKYKVDNKKIIDKLININKPDFKLSEISEDIKHFKNNLNKLSTETIDKLNKTICDVITDEILEECLYILIDKCISEPLYVDLYVCILKSILDLHELDIRYIINDKIKKVFDETIITENISEYDKLCNINKRLDESIGLCILIVTLEKSFIIQDYIKNTIDKFFLTIDTSNTELSDKSISSLYTIFKLLDSRFITVYEDKLNSVKKKDIGKKNRFKIMDIFDLKK